MISEAPPHPDVYTSDGRLLFPGSFITDGQGVWQSSGDREIGTVWGHGAYVAPDWSADWLQRESEIALRKHQSFGCPVVHRFKEGAVALLQAPALAPVDDLPAPNQTENTVSHIFL